MRGKLNCRFCEAIFSNNQTIQFGGRRPFAIPGSSVHYAPDRPFKLEHILLDLFIDPKNQTVSGKTTQKIRVISPQQWLKLDQIGLDIQEVKQGSTSVPFQVQGHELNIDLGTDLKEGQFLEITIQYRVSHPKRGIYFTGPDSDYPKKRFQVWTQGQDEDSRFWFPTMDYPNQKSTSEVIATVPAGFTAVSNGALLSKTTVTNGIRFHYKLGSPHVTYLITLVVAELTEWSDAGPRGLPVQYFVEPGREADGKRAFSNTPQMIEVFEKKTGVLYPFEKYSQTAVQDFIFGGMENTSATTQTDLTLHDERAHLDFSSDPLVSHELAHQWFGDLITCRDWSHGWLNEGFATFMERVWVESNPGSGGGLDEAKYYSYQDLKEYFSEDGKKYRRPIVCNTYIEPIDLFDTHLYQKGGLVLNLIRYVLGEDQFWKSVQTYIKRHQGQSVETLDLIRSIEDVTGKNLRRLFDEWVFNAGFPEFEVSYTWHEDKKLTEWIISQKQTDGAPSLTCDGVTTPLFHLPVVLELTLDSGEKISHRVEIGEVRDRVFLPSPKKPLMVRFDPGFNIPKKLKFPRPKEMLLFQLKNDQDCMGRIEAAQELVSLADLEVVTALGKATASDAFWGVQVECAKALSEIKTNASRDQLIAALSVKHPKARKGIIQALGKFRDPSVSKALQKYAEKDPSYFVEAESIHSWVSSQLNPIVNFGNSDIKQIEKFVLNQLEKESYRDVIRAASLHALAELPGIDRGERPHVLETLVHWTKRGGSTDVRGAAVRALGKILKSAHPPIKASLLEVFSYVGEEDNFRLRMQIVLALEESGCSEAIPILEKVRSLDMDGRVKRAAQNVIDHLRTAGGVPESVTTLKNALEKLEEEYRKLKALVEEQRAGNIR